ncbi:MAG: hypothetical protein CVV50_05910, partial [Spirochaetae bacterium HGW-Spirochaetae-6]
VYFGDIQKAKRDLELIEANIKYVENPFTLSQVYHVCAVCSAMGGIDYDKTLTYSAISYDFAAKMNYTLFQYSSLFSRVLGHFFKKDYIKSQNAIDEALEMSKKHDFFIGITLFYAFQIENYFWQGNFKKALRLASKYLKSPLAAADKFSTMVFLRHLALSHIFENRFSEALEKLDEGLLIYRQHQINNEGVIFLHLKKYILSLLNKSTQDIEVELQKLYQDHPGIMIYFQRADELLQYVDEERHILFSAKEYESSPSVVKEKIQLNNIIKTSQGLSSILDVDQLLRMVMEKTMEVTGAERGALLLYNETTTELEHKLLHNFHEGFQVSRSILERVLQTKKGVVLTSLDDSHISVSQSIVKDNIKS